MSSEQEQIRSVAERVARRLGASSGAGEAGAPSEDLAALRRNLDEMRRRLTEVESHLRHDEGAREESKAAAPPPTRSLWLSGTYVPATGHPSEERFGVGEAVSELVDYFEREKTCNVEPGGKPCDHCGMCSSRGF